MYISAQISDGLGNRFFQVAAMLWYTKLYGHKPVFIKSLIKENKHPGPHGIEFYFPDIQSKELEGQLSIVEPPFSLSHTYINLPQVEGNLLLKGFFQAWQYVDIPLPYVLRTSEFQIANSFFIHVRRGDYLLCNHHVVNLEEYMKRAIGLMPSNSTVIACSDDISWCKSELPAMIGRNDCLFYEGYDYQTLAMMVHCDKGGICANSTFSWWGAYWGSRLDPSRIYTVPDVWGYAPLPPVEDLLAPWTTVVSTSCSQV
jgi:hypothetical protein